MSDYWSYTHALLTTTLQMAVPMWLEDLRHKDKSYIEKRAQACAEELKEHHTQLYDLSPDSNLTFDRLAEGLACLALLNRGGEVFGLHWKAFLSVDRPSDIKKLLHAFTELVVCALNKKAQPTKSKKKKLKIVRKKNA